MYFAEETIVSTKLGVTVAIAGPLLTSTDHLSDHTYVSKYAELDVPFGLSMNNFPKIKKMVDKNPALIPAAKIMLRPNLAASTVKNYSSTVNKFAEYCAFNDLKYPAFEESTVLTYLAEGFINQEPYSFYQKTVPALKAIETVLGTERSALTSHVIQANNSLRREEARKRPKIKKPHLFPIDTLNHIISVVVSPFELCPWEIDVTEFRALVRGIIYYYTFCRFSDYIILKDADFTDMIHYITIDFRHSKNDQFFQGSLSVIAARPDDPCCPVRLIRLYFQRFDLNFAKQGPSKGYVNFRVAKYGGHYRALHNTRLGLSTATSQFRSLLSKYGYEGQKFTEKSFKASGTTALLDAGEPLENVMLAGRWRNTITPLHYRQTSMKFRLDIAKRVPRRANI